MLINVNSSCIHDIPKHETPLKSPSKSKCMNWVWVIPITDHTSVRKRTKLPLYAMCLETWQKTTLTKIPVANHTNHSNSLNELTVSTFQSKGVESGDGCVYAREYSGDYCHDGTVQNLSHTDIFLLVICYVFAKSCHGSEYRVCEIPVS